jgi:hypothetical protein
MWRAGTGRARRQLRGTTCARMQSGGGSNGTFVMSLPTYPLRGRSCPPSLPLKMVPIPGNVFLSTTVGDSGGDKLSKFSSCARISRIRTRETVPMSTVKGVTDRGDLHSEGIHNGRHPPRPKPILSTLVKHRVCSKIPNLEHRRIFQEM